MFLIKKLIKTIFKRLTCRNHEYKQVCKLFATHTKLGVEVVFEYEFVCVKCGKPLIVKMNEEHQLNNELFKSNEY